MKFLIQNTTSENKFITRFGGHKMCIPAQDFVEFDSDDILECNYWSNLIHNPVEGINVVTDATRIKLLNKMKFCGKYGNVSNAVKVNVPKKVEPTINSVKDKPVEASIESVETVVEKTMEPVVDIPIITDSEAVKEVVEETKEIATEDEVTVEDTTVDDNVVEEVAIPDDIPFTQEELSTKTKEELLAILDTYDIEYKKNYSVSRLINLILDNCK